MAALIALNTLNGINAAEKMDAMPLNANFVANTPVLSRKNAYIAAIHLIAVLCSLQKVSMYLQQNLVVLSLPI